MILDQLESVNIVMMCLRVMGGLPGGLADNGGALCCKFPRGVSRFRFLGSRAVDSLEVRNKEQWETLSNLQLRRHDRSLNLMLAIYNLASQTFAPQTRASMSPLSNHSTESDSTEILHAKQAMSVAEFKRVDKY